MKNVLAEFEVNRNIRYSEEIIDENLTIKSELRSGHFFWFFLASTVGVFFHTAHKCQWALGRGRRCGGTS